MNSSDNRVALPSSKESWKDPVVIMAGCLTAYSTSFQGKFQFDDIPAILENPTIVHLWPLSAALRPPTGGLTVSGRPLVNLTLALNHALSGDRPWSYHAFNLLIHLGVALTLYGLVRRTLRLTKSPHADQIAFATALIWVVHPLTTEAVTYIVQRAESLMALFYLLTLYSFTRSVDGQNSHRSEKAWQVGAIIFCWLGMATKEVMVTAPVTVLLYDRIFVAKSWRAAWKSRAGFYLSLAASWVLLLWLVAGAGWDRGASYKFSDGWVGYWFSQGEALTRYIGLSVFPFPLAFDYGPATWPPLLNDVLSSLAIAAFFFTAWKAWTGSRWAFLAAGFFLVLAPTSVMPGVMQFAAEHRMYLPLTAVVTAAVCAAQFWVETNHPNGNLRKGLPLILALLVALLGTATAWRSRVYRSDLLLWTDTIEKRPKSALAQANVGKALTDQGRSSEAMVYFKKSVELDPGKPITHYNLGLAYEDTEQWDAALGEFMTAAKLNPKLFYAEFRAGRLLDRAGQGQEAASWLQQALVNEPDFPEAHASLGVAYKLQGKPPEAIEEFKESLRLQPNQPETEFNLGVSLAALGQIPEAASHYERAIRLQKDYGQAQLNWGVAQAQMGQPAKALPALRSAALLMPKSPEAHASLATVLDQLGRTPEAIVEYGRTLMLNPNYAEAHYNLGNALIHVRRLDEARAEFAEAVRLHPGFTAAQAMLDRLDQLSSGH